MEKRELDVGVEYGMSARCCATLAKEELIGRTTRQLIGIVAEKELSKDHCNDRIRRAARISREVIGRRRHLNVEVLNGKKDKLESGKKIGLDEVVYKPDNGQVQTDKMTLRITEPLVGGSAAGCA